MTIELQLTVRGTQETLELATADLKIPDPKKEVAIAQLKEDDEEKRRETASTI